MRSLERDFAVQHTFETHRAVVVLRAVRRSDGLPVILKHPAAEVPTESEIGRLKYEFEVLSRLQAAIPEAHVIKPVQLWGHDDGTTLVLHDVGGVSLASCMEQGRLAQGAVISIGLQALAALQQVHLSGLLHKDVNPRNLVYVAETGAVQLIDFGIAARMHQETSAAAQLAVEGTLAYAPPEQMGRVSRHADHRTDYYSLGTTLYELLTGARPFAQEDPAQLMHAILTEQPVPPHVRDPQVPEFLSAIVMKLLEKAQEARYQSARGLAHDLQRAAPASSAAAAGGGHDRGAAARAVPGRPAVGRRRHRALSGEPHHRGAAHRWHVRVGGLPRR